MSFNFIDSPSTTDPTDRERPRSNLPASESGRALRGLEWAAALTGDSCVLGAEVTGPLTVGVLRQAGLRLQRRYPCLRSRWHIDGESLFPTGLLFSPPDPRWLHIEEIRLPIADRERDATLLDGLVEEHLNRSFDVKAGYLCRIIWVPSRTEGGHVLLRISEAVADAHSLVYLYRGLLMECARILQGPTRYDPATLDMEDDPLSVLDWAPFRAQAWLSAGARRLSQLLVPRATPAATQGVTELANVWPPVPTRCLGLEGDPSHYAALMCCLREANLELASLLGAAAGRAILVASGAGNDAPPRLALEFELRRDLRGRATSSLLGLFTGVATLAEPVRCGSSLLEQASALQDWSRRRIRRGTPWSPHFELEQLVASHGPAIAKELMEEASRTMPAALYIGSVADETLPSRIGPLSIGHVRMARRASLRSAPFALWVCAGEDRLHYCLTCRDEPDAVEGGRALVEQIRYWTERGIEGV